MSNGFKNCDHRYFNSPCKSSIFVISTRELLSLVHYIYLKILTEFTLCAAIFARTKKSVTLGDQYETLSSLPPREKDYHQIMNDSTTVACNLTSIG